MATQSACKTKKRKGYEKVILSFNHYNSSWNNSSYANYYKQIRMSNKVPNKENMQTYKKLGVKVEMNIITTYFHFFVRKNLLASL